jgi:hypothetical protein
VASGARQGRSWQNIGRVTAAITAFVVGAGALATALVKLGAAYPVLLPFWAPFDAAISLRDIRVEKSSPSTSTFSGGLPEDAVNVNITYVEEKKGRSTLRQCLPQLRLDQVYGPTPATPRDISEVDWQQEKTETFVVPKKNYLQAGNFRLFCEGRITTWTPITLLAVQGVSAQISTYNLCRGQYPAVCGPGATFLPCELDATVWAKNSHPTECAKSVEITVLSDVSGNRCGYQRIAVKCTPNS